PLYARSLPARLTTVFRTATMDRASQDASRPRKGPSPPAWSIVTTPIFFQPVIADPGAFERRSSMVEPSSRLPARPSLEQLRKQAKERLRARRLTEPDATLASVQFDLAREYGFESWPKLVEHIQKVSPSRIEQFE